MKKIILLFISLLRAVGVGLASMSMMLAFLSPMVNAFAVEATCSHTFASNDSHQTFCTTCKHTFFRYKSENEISPKAASLKDANGKSLTFTNTFVDGNGVLEIDGQLVTIGNDAFRGRSFTGSLIIPNSVTTIGDLAFYNCSGFTGSLIIPNSVTSIGEKAFQGCRGFTGTLVIPNSVTTIGASAFCNCSGFTGDLNIPNSVTTIAGYAFSGCSGFTGTLNIPNSVTRIAGQAFDGCSGFTGTLVIPNSVTTIGASAFYKCSGFTGNLDIPNSVTTIGNFAFDGCSGFNGTLDIPNSVTTIGASAFRDCSGFTGTLNIPNSVRSIGDRAFYNCNGFTGALIIPNSVWSVGDRAFYKCGDFTEMKIKDFQIGKDLTLSLEKDTWVCHEELTIEDGVALKSPMNFKADKVVYNRVAQKDTMSIILPFDVPADLLNGVAYKLASFDGKNLHFETIDGIKANTPCMLSGIKTLDEPVITAELENVTIKASSPIEVKDATGKSVHFGVYEKKLFECDAYDYYGFKDNKFVKAGIDIEMSPFRAAVRLTKSALRSLSYNPATLGIVFDGNEVTHAADMEQTTTGKVNVYAVTGRTLRLNVEAENCTEGLEPGVYVVNGKKVVVTVKE